MLTDYEGDDYQDYGDDLLKMRRLSDNNLTSFAHVLMGVTVNLCMRRVCTCNLRTATEFVFKILAVLENVFCV